MRCKPSAIFGLCRPAGSTEKFPALLQIDTVSGMDPEVARLRPRFEDLTPVEDVRVEGMQHIYRNNGLGVTLIAHRRVDPSSSPDPLDRFHPRELRLPATAASPGARCFTERKFRRRSACPNLEQRPRAGAEFCHKRL